jgi:hypothetical protein
MGDQVLNRIQEDLVRFFRRDGREGDLEVVLPSIDDEIEAAALQLKFSFTHYLTWAVSSIVERRDVSFVRLVTTTAFNPQGRIFSVLRIHGNEFSFIDNGVTLAVVNIDDETLSNHIGLFNFLAARNIVPGSVVTKNFNESVSIYDFLLYKFAVMNVGSILYHFQSQPVDLDGIIWEVNDVKKIPGETIELHISIPINIESYEKIGALFISANIIFDRIMKTIDVENEYYEGAILKTFGLQDKIDVDQRVYLELILEAEYIPSNVYEEFSAKRKNLREMSNKELDRMASEFNVPIYRSREQIAEDVNQAIRRLRYKDML